MRVQIHRNEGKEKKLGLAPPPVTHHRLSAVPGETGLGEGRKMKAIPVWA